MSIQCRMLAVVVAVVPALAFAGPPVIGLEFDAPIPFYSPTCRISLPALAPVTLHIEAFTDAGNAPFHGAEFSISGLPPQVFVTATANPSATLVEGGPFLPAGARILLPACAAGQRMLLYDVQLIALAPANDVTLTLGPHPQPTNPVATCAAVLGCGGTPECAVGGVNALGPSSAQPNPANGAAQVPVNAQLSFDLLDGGVPCGCASSEDVALYFGAGANPPLVARGDIGHTFDPGALSPDTEYFWRIDWAWCGASLHSPLWSFHTGGPLAVQQRAWSVVKTLYR